ncbi:MAG TPA: urea ABC transporter ATP-binding subunit UrtE [bacterium]|nr:urea ABC transporter ATP-binding subunit UrtE [bacterium]
MLLRTDHLDFAYGEAKVLHGIDLSVEARKITCVIGRNGVGKTTLLKALMGVLRARSGKVWLADKDVTALPAHQRAKLGINLVPQGRDIFPGLTVEENLRIGLEARTDGLKEIPEDIYGLFPVLRTMKGRRGGDLSGGQQQQLAIGRALAGNPGVLLLDEPTEGIQPSIIKEIGQVLKKLAVERGITIVLVEQYLDFVREIGDSFVLMNRGRIVHQGLTRELSKATVSEHLQV